MITKFIICYHLIIIYNLIGDYLPQQSTDKDRYCDSVVGLRQ